MSPSEFQWIAKNPGRHYGPLAVVVIAHLPLVFIHCTHLWENGLHAHFPLVLGGVIAILWSRWDGTRTPGRWRTAFSVGAIGCGGLLLLMGILLWSPWLGFVAALVTSGGILLHACPAPVRAWGPAWLLLWLLVPLPMGLDRQLSLKLQSYSSRAASLALDFFHVNHVRTGNVIEVPEMKFSVEEACIGIHSLFVLIAAAAILVVVLRRWWPHAIGLILAAACWAGASNMVRVAGVVIAASRFQMDLSTGWRHEFWGLALFGIAFGLVLSTDRVLSLIFMTEDGVIGDEDSSRDTTPMREELPHLADATEDSLDGHRRLPQLGFLRWWALAAFFACIGSLQLVLSTSSALSILAPPARAGTPLSLASFSEETLPFELGGWQRAGYETERRSAADMDGAFSAIWRYERGGREAVVSLDFPFTDWHQLTQCYLGRGCRVLGWQLEPLTERAGSPSVGDLAVTSLEMERGRRALLQFAEWNSAGEFLKPPTTAGPSWTRILADVQSRWNGRRGSFPNACVYQLQVLSLTPRVVAGEDDAATDHATAVRRLFSEATRVLRPKTLETPGGTT